MPKSKKKGDGRRTVQSRAWSSRNTSEPETSTMGQSTIEILPGLACALVWTTVVAKRARAKAARGRREKRRKNIEKREGNTWGVGKERRERESCGSLIGHGERNRGKLIRWGATWHLLID